MGVCECVFVSLRVCADAPCHANVCLQVWVHLYVYSIFICSEYYHARVSTCLLHLQNQNHTRVRGERLLKGHSCCILESVFHSYTCTRIYGDNRCYLESMKRSSAFLKNESITNHFFFSLFKANKYPDFLKPLKSVAKYWEHKEVSEKWSEWQYGSSEPAPTQAFLSADGWHH